MSVIISFIMIGLIKIVSSVSSNKVCVYGSPMGNVNKGLQGEYTYGGLDSNGNEYWTMKTNCWLGDNVPDNTLYVRKSTTFHKWEISYELADDCYYYGCDHDTTLPSECGNNNWIGAAGPKQDFYILAGECPSYNNGKSYLTVTDYPGFWEGCNGEYIAVDGKKNLFQRIEEYDYGWGHLPHYWLYSITNQQWHCADTTDVPSIDDYSNGCYQWRIRGGFNMNFHDN